MWNGKNVLCTNGLDFPCLYLDGLWDWWIDIQRQNVDICLLYKWSALCNNPMCETDGFQKVKVDTVEQIQLQIHLNKYWGVSAGLDWNLPLERFGNVSIKKTNVSHRVDKLWEMALRGQFSIHSKVHCTLYLVQPPLNITTLCDTVLCTRHYTAVHSALCCNKLHFCTVIHRPSAPQ